MVVLEISPTGHDWQKDWIVDIVAIHGLDEDHTTAWVDSVSGINWLKDLLPKYLSSARILSYGYASGSADSPSNANSERILQHAQTLVAELEADRSTANATRRPIIFVCHDLGGIVVKRALAYSASRTSQKVAHLYSIFVSTYGILFFGTPHNGFSPSWLSSHVQSWTEMHDLRGATGNSSETLQNINDQFAPLMKQFHIHYFWEQQETVNTRGCGFVVEESSAAPIVDDTERSGIYATHAQMCKFAGVDSPGFLVVRATLHRYSRDANEIIATRWLQALSLLERLRHYEAAELVASDPQSGKSLVIYDKYATTFRNKHYRVPYTASNIFTGRKDVSQRLEKSFLSKSAKINSPVQKRFVLYGLGGQGKTQFCLKFIQDYRQSFWGIFWIDASTVENAQQDFCKIAKIEKAGDSFDDGKHWLTSLEFSWMLVIDNADDPSIDVSQFFPAGDRGHILLTSRNSDCRSLETVGYQELKEMEMEDAITLLLRAAGKDPDDLKLRKLAKPITQALGRLPLALDQAGAAIRQNICSLKGYLTLFHRHRKQILGTKAVQGSDAYKYTLYTTWEVSFQMIKKLERPIAVDTREILQIFAFLHFQQVPAGLLQRAWQNSARSQSWVPSKTFIARLLAAFRPKRESDQPEEPPQLLHQTGLHWDTIRFRKALSTLAQFSLISRDTDQDEDTPVMANDQSSLESQTVSEGSYSMHPLVHFWARDRMTETDQRLWFDVTTKTLAKSISTGQGAAEQAYRRSLIPHIDAFFNGQHTFPLLTPDSDLQAVKKVFRMTQVYSEGGRWHSARPLQEEVVQRRTSILGPDHPETLDAVSSLGTTYWNSGMTEQAADLRRRELEIKIRIHGSDDLETLKATDELAHTYWLCGRWSDAEELGLKAVHGLRSQLGTAHKDVIESTIHLARVYKHQGAADKGLELLLRFTHECEKEHGANSFVTINVKAELGMLYHSTNQLDKAQELLETVLEFRRGALGKEHAYTLWAINDLSKIFNAQGRSIEAEEMLTSILDVVRSTLGPEHVGMTMTLANIASAYSSQGRFREAENVLADLGGILKKKINNGEIEGLHPDYLDFLYQRSRNLGQRGRKEDARKGFEELLPMLELKLGREHPRIKNARARLEEIGKGEEKGVN